MSTAASGLATNGPTNRLLDETALASSTALAIEHNLLALYVKRNHVLE